MSNPNTAQNLESAIAAARAAAESTSGPIADKLQNAAMAVLPTEGATARGARLETENVILGKVPTAKTSDAISDAAGKKVDKAIDKLQTLGSSLSAIGIDRAALIAAQIAVDALAAHVSDLQKRGVAHAARGFVRLLDL